MKSINHELLTESASRGLTIHEGVAIDARLVRSASRPLSEDRLKEESMKPDLLEGTSDKHESRRNSPVISIPAGQ